MVLYFHKTDNSEDSSFCPSAETLCKILNISTRLLKERSLAVFENVRIATRAYEQCIECKPWSPMSEFWVINVCFLGNRLTDWYSGTARQLTIVR